MRKILSKAGIVALVLALFALGQAACGGGGYSSPTAPSSAPGQPTPTPMPGRGY
jgi:hypothetical protein